MSQLYLRSPVLTRSMTDIARQYKKSKKHPLVVGVPIPILHDVNQPLDDVNQAVFEINQKANEEIKRDADDNAPIVPEVRLNEQGVLQQDAGLVVHPPVGDIEVAINVTLPKAVFTILNEAKKEWKSCYISLFEIRATIDDMSLHGKLGRDLIPEIKAFKSIKAAPLLVKESLKSIIDKASCEMKTVVEKNLLQSLKDAEIDVIAMTDMVENDLYRNIEIFLTEVNKTFPFDVIGGIGTIKRKFSKYKLNIISDVLLAHNRHKDLRISAIEKKEEAKRRDEQMPVKDLISNLIDLKLKGKPKVKVDPPKKGAPRVPTNPKGKPKPKPKAKEKLKPKHDAPKKKKPLKGWVYDSSIYDMVYDYIGIDTNSNADSYSVYDISLLELQNMMSNKVVHVYTDTIIPTFITNVLSYNDKFIPYPQYSLSDKHKEALRLFCRRIRIKYMFKGKPDRLIPPLYVPNPSFIPNDDNLSDDGIKYMDNITGTFKRLLFNEHHIKSKPPPIIYRTRDWFSQHQNVIKVTCDKNLGVAIVDTSWYLEQVYSHLNNTSNYGRVNLTVSSSNLLTLNTAVFEDMIDKIKDLNINHFITKSAIEYISQDFIIDKKLHYERIRTPHFYITAKVHKTPIASRPIVSSINSVTYRAAKWVDYHLQKLMPIIPTYIQDSNRITRDVEGSGVLDSNAILVTADVESLYPNIDTQDGLLSIKRLLLKHQDIIPIEIGKLIMMLLQFILEHNFFIFNNELFLQISGTAMGSPLSVSYANLYLHTLETEANDLLTREDPLLVPSYFRRFIDDLLMVFNLYNNAIKFIDTFNNLRPKIKITSNISSTSVEFLDIVLYKGERFNTMGRLDTRVHQKALNLYLYIPFNSMHTRAMLRGFIKAEVLRYIRISSNVTDFIMVRRCFIQRLLKRGYPPKFITDVIFDLDYYVERDRILKLLCVKYPDVQPKRRCRVIGTNKSNNALDIIPKSIIPCIIPYDTRVQQCYSRLKVEFNYFTDYLKDLLPHKPLLSFSTMPNLGRLLNDKRFYKIQNL